MEYNSDHSSHEPHELPNYLEPFSSEQQPVQLSLILLVLNDFPVVQAHHQKVVRNQTTHIS